MRYYTLLRLQIYLSCNLLITMVISYKRRTFPKQSMYFPMIHVISFNAYCEVVDNICEVNNDGIGYTNYQVYTTFTEGIKSTLLSSNMTALTLNLKYETLDCERKNKLVNCYSKEVIKALNMNTCKQ